MFGGLVSFWLWGLSVESFGGCVGSSLSNQRGPVHDPDGVLHEVGSSGASCMGVSSALAAER